jgi:hypothetical protein
MDYAKDEEEARIVFTIPDLWVECMSVNDAIDTADCVLGDDFTRRLRE